jgi:hypothetical protein
MPSLEKKYRHGVILTWLLTLGMAAGAPVFAQFCALNPISPLCCPSPCPVFDPTRVPKLVADVTSLEQTVSAESQIVQSMTQLGKTIGNTAASVVSITRQLSAFPFTISGEVTPVQGGLPSDPVAALGALEQTIFESGSLGKTSVKQSAARSAAREAAAQQEQVAGLTISLMKSSTLTSAWSLQSQLAGTASASEQLRVDLAANSMARLALYQDMGALHQLAAAWLSQRAAGSAVKHPDVAGGMIAQAAAGPSGQSAEGWSSTPTLQSMADQLVSLHDSRVSAQALLTAYPSLRQTIASSGVADQFARSAESTLQTSLSALEGISPSTLPDVENALQTADRTGWLSHGKDEQAQRAAARVLAALVASGTVSQAQFVNDSSVGQQLQEAMSAWLDAHKQSQYWAQLCGFRSFRPPIPIIIRPLLPIVKAAF